VLTHLLGPLHTLVTVGFRPYGRYPAPVLAHLLGPLHTFSPHRRIGLLEVSHYIHCVLPLYFIYDMLSKKYGSYA
jgi:hypothetical protein